MNTKREIEALDEALLYLNEGKNKTQQDRIQIREKITRAIRYFVQIQGKTFFRFDINNVRFLGGAATNIDFVNGKSKSFVITLSPGSNTSIGTASFLCGKVDMKVISNYSELGDIVKLINSKRKEVENTVFERTGIKVSIKIGDPHKLNNRPTIIVTLR